MTDDADRKSVDEGWKDEVRREKETLLEKEKSAREAVDSERQLPPADFVHFISGMAAQVLMQLGEIENPFAGERMVDLPSARYSIDILQMLADKTKGNLTPEEERYIRAALHDLRLRFIEAASPKQNTDAAE